MTRRSKGKNVITQTPPQYLNQHEIFQKVIQDLIEKFDDVKKYIVSNGAMEGFKDMFRKM